MAKGKQPASEASRHELAIELGLPASESMGAGLPQRRADLLVRIQQVALVASGALVTILIIVQVFTRYVMRISIFGIEDLASFIAVWLYFIGGAVGAWERGHISASLVDLFVKSERTRDRVRAGAAALTTIVSGWMTVWAFQYFMFTVERRQMSLEIDLPMAYVTVVMPLGLALMTFYFFLDTLDYLAAARRSR